MIKIFVFLLGLIVGSFLNCVIYRIEMEEQGGITCFIKGRPQKKSFGFLRGKSFCPHCKKKLAWYDLFPVLSFIALKGKCRNCKKKISWQYPLVELGTALLFLLIVSSRLTFLSEFFLLIISSLLVIVFVYDLKHMIIPDRIIFSAIIITFIYQLFNFKLGVLNNLLMGLIAGSLFLFVVLISNGKWMVAGDVKLAFLIGLLLGFPNFIVA
jgi:leader peptidase (prepilin peptidase)/N-methyltransferase